MSINHHVKTFHSLIQKGEIQVAYKGIIDFLNGFKSYLQKNNPNWNVSALYQGYFDMSYFAITPEKFIGEKLKFAFVYLYDFNRFEIWLSGTNKQVMEKYRKKLQGNRYFLVTREPSDAIIEHVLIRHPNFDSPDETKHEMETKIHEFIVQLEDLLH